jgi:hypothetical protein
MTSVSSLDAFELVSQIGDEGAVWMIYAWA